MSKAVRRPHRSINAAPQPAGRDYRTASALEREAALRAQLDRGEHVSHFRCYAADIDEELDPRRAVL